MTADEILKTDTSKKSLNELVNMLDGEIFADPELFGEEVYKLASARRKRRAYRWKRTPSGDRKRN